MAVTIGKLAVSLSAQTSQFEKGMKRASDTTASFKDDILRVGKIVGAFAAVSMAKDAVGGVMGMVKAEMEAIDATAKLSDNLNIATESLVGLRYAASLSGSSVEGMDKALETLNRRLGEAKMGTGEAKDGLAALGLTAADLSLMDTGQAFVQIADKLQGVALASDKAAIAYKLFGRQGQQLLNTLALGSKGLQAVQEDAEKLGITFTRIDAAKVEAANDAIFRLKEAGRGLITQLAIEFAPAITTVANELTDMSTDGETMSTIIIGGVAGMTESFGVLLNVMDDVIHGYAAMEAAGANFVANATKGYRDYAKEAAKGMLKIAGLNVSDEFISQNSSIMGVLDNAATAADQLASDATDSLLANDKRRQEVGKLGDTFIKLAAAAREAAAAQKAGVAAPDGIAAAAKLADQVDAMVARLTDQRMALQMTGREFEIYKLRAMGASDAQIEQVDALLRSIESMQELNALMDEGAKLTKDLQTPSEQFADAVKNLDKLLNAGAIGMETYTRAVERAKEQLEAAYDAQQQLARGSQLDMFSQLDLSGYGGAMPVSETPAAGGAFTTPQTIEVEGQDQTNEILRSIDTRLGRGLPMVLTG